MSDARRLADLRRAQLRAREIKRGVGAMYEGRSGLAAPVTGYRQRGGRQAAVTVQTPGASPAHDGRHLHTLVPAQTWDDGPLDLGDTVVQNVGWSDNAPLSGVSTEWTVPAGDSYWDLELELETDASDLGSRDGAGVDITLTVDGETLRTWTDVWVVDQLQFVYRIGGLDKAQDVAVEVSGPYALEVLGGHAIMQLVDRQKSQAQEAGVEPPGSVTETTDSVRTFSDPAETSTVAPSGVTAGDVMVAVFGWVTPTTAADTVNVPSGWTELHQRADDTDEDGMWLGWRVADADDEAQSRTYTWSVGGSGNKGCAVSLFALPAGATLGAVNAAFGAGVSSLSVADPGGDWTLAVAVGTNGPSGGAGGDLLLDSPATSYFTFVPDTNGDRSNHRVGWQDGGTVEATFGDYRSCFLAAVGVA